MEPLPPVVAEVLARVPALRGIDPSSCGAVRLHGLTNRAYRVRCPAAEVAVRVPAPGAAAWVDRAAEAHNARLAAKMGLGPEVLYAHAPSGTLVTRWLEGDDLASGLRSGREEAIRAAAEALRALHASGAPFRGRIRLDLLLSEHVARVGTRDAPWPERSEDALAAVAGVVAALARHPQVPAPCHNDPSPANWRGAAGRPRLVDWEYSAYGEPAWDLACLACEAGFGPEQDRMLLSAYRGSEPSPADLARHALFRPALDLVAGLWFLARHGSDSGEPYDRLAMAHERIDRSAAVLRGIDLRAAMVDLGSGQDPPGRAAVRAPGPGPGAT